jgi:hypothetical protein
MVNVPNVATFAGSHSRQLVQALDFQLIKLCQPARRPLELCTFSSHLQFCADRLIFGAVSRQSVQMRLP